LTDTSEQLCFYFCSFSFFHFLVFGSVQKIKLTCVSFSAQVKTAPYRIVFGWLNNPQLADVSQKRGTASFNKC